MNKPSRLWAALKNVRLVLIVLVALLVGTFAAVLALASDSELAQALLTGGGATGTTVGLLHQITTPRTCDRHNDE
ncbi:hypothetical protein [Actinomadura kijaniata]|uniref:hypothetical protein n=1 Tax=Actinomadura kijaniata TaxID=46161 RepID=UPI000832A8E6|nr:hypothetical protein [Actinomadura kijaniata]